MRECGDCTMCCRLLEVTELNKPANQWCSHCQPRFNIRTQPHQGCTIYSTRPPSCREYECLWLQLPELPEELQPRRCGAVLGLSATGENVVVYVDPRRPDTYRMNKYLREFIIRQLKEQRDVYIVCGESRKLLPAKRSDLPDFEATSDVLGWQGPELQFISGEGE